MGVPTDITKGSPHLEKEEKKKLFRGNWQILDPVIIEDWSLTYTAQYSVKWVGNV